MKAVVFDKGLKLVNDYKKPVPQKGEALVRVTLAGICNTDYEITKGYMGYKGILGHEAVGIVEEISFGQTCGFRNKLRMQTARMLLLC